jgi:uncharacterized protein (DUF302 family)
MESSVMRGSKMSKLILIVAGTFLLGAHAMAADGLTTIPSSYGPKETMDRLEAEIKAKGMTVFARIDHAAGAAQAGLSLRPTEVLMFGNAKAGTPLMQSNQTIGIDLPLKALVWQDATARFGCPITSRAGSRRVTEWRPQPKRRSTPWRAASAISREGPPASSDTWLLGCQVRWRTGL